MKRRVQLLGASLCVVASLCLVRVEAHDLWLVAQPGGVPVGKDVFLFAQTGMKFPESLSAVAPDRLDGAWFVDATGRHSMESYATDGNSLRFKVRFERPGIALAAVAVKPNFIQLDAKDFNEYLELDGLPQILEIRKAKGQLDKEAREMYAKFAKAILRVGEGGPSDLAVRPAGLRIEIVPLRNPSQIGPRGGEIPVEVLFEGRPLEGVYVYALAEGKDEYGQGYRTGQDGKAVVPIGAAGLWSLHCIHMRPHADSAKADWESFFATTSFVAGPK